MRVRFGIMADAHTEFMHDGPARVRTFLEACQKENCDFCVDLGDFCPPGKMNATDKEKIRSLLKHFPLPFYYALGNHDTDANKKSAVRAYLGCENQPYSFDLGGVHFVFPDACYFREGSKEIEYANGNYRLTRGTISVLPSRELERLREDLAKAKHPAVLFTHHSLIESRTGIRNPQEFRSAIQNAPHGVLLAACGHEHVDRLEEKDGTYYWCVNSMSYYWAGEKYSHTTYGEAIEHEHPLLRAVFPYRDPLFAIVEITDETVTVQGRSSEIVGCTPQALQFSKRGLCDPITAAIQSRTLPIQK